MKTCRDCGLTKPLNEFYTSRYVTKAGGVSVYHFGHCKTCDVLRKQATKKRRKAEVEVAEQEREAEEAMAETTGGVYVIGEVAFQDMLRKIAQSDEWTAEFLGTLKPVRNAQSVKSMRAKMYEAQGHE